LALLLLTPGTRIGFSLTAKKAEVDAYIENPKRSERERMADVKNHFWSICELCRTSVYERTNSGLDWGLCPCRLGTGAVMAVPCGRKRLCFCEFLQRAKGSQYQKYFSKTFLKAYGSKKVFTKDLDFKWIRLQKKELQSNEELEN
jgi:hypothetical protein